MYLPHWSPLFDDNKQDWYENTTDCLDNILERKLVCSPKLAHENKRKGSAHVKKFIISGFQTAAGRGSASVLRVSVGEGTKENRDSSQRSARALKRLKAHNKSPKDIVESEESEGNQNRPREDISHQRSGSRSRHRSMEVEERSRSRSQASSRHEHSKSPRRKVATHGLTNGDKNDLEADILVPPPAKTSPP